jgi:hypothetical protein
VLDDLAALEPDDVNVVLRDFSTGRRETHELTGVPSMMGGVDGSASPDGKIASQICRAWDPFAGTVDLSR